jgi:hypothetical protein
VAQIARSLGLHPAGCTHPSWESKAKATSKLLFSGHLDLANVSGAEDDEQQRIAAQLAAQRRPAERAQQDAKSKEQREKEKKERQGEGGRT